MVPHLVSHSFGRVPTYACFASFFRLGRYCTQDAPVSSSVQPTALRSAKQAIECSLPVHIKRPSVRPSHHCFLHSTHPAATDQLRKHSTADSPEQDHVLPYIILRTHVPSRIEFSPLFSRFMHIAGITDWGPEQDSGILLPAPPFRFRPSALYCRESPAVYGPPQCLFSVLCMP